MPRLDSDVKLDFKDVLVRPKRSTLKSRADVSNIIRKLHLHRLILVCFQVSLHREFTFRNSKHKYNGIPIIASNMDTVGTFESAIALARVSMLKI